MPLLYSFRYKFRYKLIYIIQSHHKLTINRFIPSSAEICDVPKEVPIPTSICQLINILFSFLFQVLSNVSVIWYMPEKGYIDMFLTGFVHYFFLGFHPEILSGNPFKESSRILSEISSGFFRKHSQSFSRDSFSEFCWDSLEDLFRDSFMDFSRDSLRESFGDSFHIFFRNSFKIPSLRILRTPS